MSPVWKCPDLISRCESRWLAGLLLVCLTGLPGCGSSTTKNSVDSGIEGDLSQLEGRVVIDGSSTVAPVSEAAAESFERDFPNVRVTVATSGTGGGFKRFTLGETDISDASRPIKASEFQLCQEHGVSFVELPIAYDGLSIVVNKENDFVQQLTVDDLKKIFLREGGAKTWRDVNPEWPDLRIKIYAPGTDSGTFDYFFGDVVAQDSENEHPRSDMSPSEDDNILVTGVAGERGAIAFFGASYYFANADKIRAVEIVNPETGKAVAPTPETIESGEYAPFSRPLFIYINEASLKRPEVRAFVDFYLDHAAELAEKVDYVALPADIYAAARSRFENRTVGTHFMTEDLSKRVGPLTEVYTEANLVSTETE